MFSIFELALISDSLVSFQNPDSEILKKLFSNIYVSEGKYFKMCGYFQFPLVFTSVKEPVVRVSLSLSGSYGEGSNAVNTGVPTFESK